MIFLTGDTHRTMDIEKLEPANFSEQRFLTRDDYLIITGDFGGVWTGTSKDDEVLNIHEQKNYTTLFVAGNHENYNALRMYPIVRWNGGLVHKIKEHVYHLMNGQIYEIDGKTFFVMGGATSVDKMFRQEDETWWAEEEPSDAECMEATTNLLAYNNKVNYIITHTVPENVRKNAFKPFSNFVEYESRVEQYLDYVYNNVTYDKWFAGHIHIDREFPEYRLRVLYNGIVKI